MRRYRWCQHEITAHQGLGLGNADAVGGHCHRHHPQLAVEMIRHVEAEGVLAIDVGDPRPPHRRALALALEGVQMFAEIALGIAAGGGAGHQPTELGQDQIKDLRGLHIEHLLAEEVVERVAQLIARHLQDAFVDGKGDDPGLATGADLERDIRSRLAHRRQRQR